MAYRSYKKKKYKKRRTYRKTYGKKAYRKRYGRKSYKKSTYKRKYTKYAKKACKCDVPKIYPKVLKSMPLVNRQKVPDFIKQKAWAIANEARAQAAAAVVEDQADNEMTDQEKSDYALQLAKAAALAEAQAAKKQRTV